MKSSKNLDGKSVEFVHVPVSHGFRRTKTLRVVTSDDIVIGPETPREVPIHVAASRGDLDECRALLDRGAQVNVPDIDGQRALHRAIEGLHLEVARLLLARNANVNAQDYAGNSPLHRAVLSGNVALVELVLAHGADVSAQNELGDTPLHTTARRGNLRVAKLLLLAASTSGLSSEALINAKNHKGLTAASYAAHAPHSSEFVAFLLANGMDVSAQATSLSTSAADLPSSAELNPLRKSESRESIPLSRTSTAKKSRPAALFESGDAATGEGGFFAKVFSSKSFSKLSPRDERERDSTVVSPVSGGGRDSLEHEPSSSRLSRASTANADRRHSRKPSRKELDLADLVYGNDAGAGTAEPGVGLKRSGGSHGRKNSWVDLGGLTSGRTPCADGSAVSFSKKLPLIDITAGASPDLSPDGSRPGDKLAPRSAKKVLLAV